MAEAGRTGRYSPIEDHGVIGNLETVALVCVTGSIDFFCFPDFDSPSVFARLLDCDNGGHFSIMPTGRSTTSRQLYLPDTNILLTRFLSDEGILEVTDFMPLSERQSHRPRVREEQRRTAGTAVPPEGTAMPPFRATACRTARCGRTCARSAGRA